MRATVAGMSRLQAAQRGHDAAEGGLDVGLALEGRDVEDGPAAAAALVLVFFSSAPALSAAAAARAGQRRVVGRDGRRAASA